MGKSTGFLEYERKDAKNISVEERIKNFNEFHTALSNDEQTYQGARCMDCGVPFCQWGGMIGGMASGCPLHNLVPETNDLVYHGNWGQAYEHLSKTHPFPEFTSRVCPALCEAACTCGVHSKPVATKDNEKAIIEYAFSNDLVKPHVPKVRTGKKVAIIGSGPAGLAAANELNKRGHSVTVYERNDRPGGLLRYGIPNMKLDKRIIDRRIKLMEESGIHFICNTNVGKDIKGEEILKLYDRVILAAGASNPRDINVPGRDALGIRFAVDFLSEVTKTLLDSDFKKIPYELAENKNVIVIGGGDTGNDCVGTAIRLKAKSVIQLEIMPMPPKVRGENNPWPQWPKVLKTDYGQEEAAFVYGKDPRMFNTSVKEFIKNEKGEVVAVITSDDKELAADLVLIAAGFLGSEGYVTETFGVQCNERANVKTQPGSYKTNVTNVFSAGDMHRGQSLVVWALAEGKEVAKEVDESLMGYTNL